MIIACSWLRLIIFALLTSAAVAQDKVTIRRGPLAGRMTIAGAIEDYTGEEITIRMSSGDMLRKYPSAEVVSVTTPHSPAHDRGLSLLREGNVKAALEDLESALRHESRGWVRREILAALVQGALRQGDYPAAGVRFLALLRSDPTTRHFRMIPLTWKTEPLSPEIRSAARSWLSGTIEAGRLIGASLLLDDPEHSAAARIALRELATSTDRRIQQLAQIQGWRVELARGTIGELEAIHWQERIDDLTPELRAGPSYLLGEAYALRHDYELAAATWLWLPLVDDHDFRLTARAGLEAGRALDRIGQQSEAEALWREVTRRFPDAPAALEAAVLLKSRAETRSSTQQDESP